MFGQRQNVLIVLLGSVNSENCMNLTYSHVNIVYNREIVNLTWK